MGTVVTQEMLDTGEVAEKDTKSKVRAPKEDSPEPEETESEAEIGKEAVDRQLDEKWEQEQLAAKAKAEKESEEESEEDFEYADQKAAEKAVKETKQRLGKQGAELGEERKKRSELEKTVAKLEAQVAEAAKTAPTPTDKPEDNPWNKKREAVSEEAMKQIADLQNRLPVVPVAPQDRDDPNFDTQWKDYLAKLNDYNTAVREFNTASRKISDKATADITRLTLQEEQEAKDNKGKVLEAVENALANADLLNPDMTEKEKEVVLRLFWSESKMVPQNITVQQQLDQTVERVKEIVNFYQGKERSRAEEDKKEKEKLQTLGRGSRVATTTTTKRKEPDTSSSLGSIRKGVLNERRVHGS